jgi:hypothetical protein
MSAIVYCYILPSYAIPRAIYQRQTSQALADLLERQRDVQFQAFPLNRLRKAEKHFVTLLRIFFFQINV